MNTTHLTIRKRVILTLLIIVPAALLYFLIYSLVYALPDSSYKKYAFILVLAFIVAGRITVKTYKNFINKRKIY